MNIVCPICEHSINHHSHEYMGCGFEDGCSCELLPLDIARIHIKDLVKLLNVIDKTFISDVISTNANVDIEYATKMRTKIINIVKKYKGE